MEPTCVTCRNFGHTTEDCVSTYVTAITGTTEVPYLHDIMNQVVADAASSIANHRADEEVMSPSEHAPLPGPAREDSDGPPDGVHMVENAAAGAEDLIFATAEEVPNVVAQKSTSSVDAPKMQKAHKSRKARHAESLESFEVADQASRHQEAPGVGVHSLRLHGTCRRQRDSVAKERSFIS